MVGRHLLSIVVWTWWLYLPDVFCHFPCAHRTRALARRLRVRWDIYTYKGYSSMFGRSYVQKVLCSEGSMFRRSFVQKVLCSEGYMFRRFYIQKVLCSEGPMFRNICSEGPMFRKYGTRRFCNVEATSMTLIQCRKNVVCSVGFSGLKWGLIKL